MSAISVVTVPLKTRIYQEDIINKRMELCRKVYNNMLHDKLKDLRKMERDHDYILSKDIINSAYKCNDKVKLKEIKKSQEYKNAQEIQKQKMNEYGFSEYAFASVVLKYVKPFSDNITGTVACYSISKPMWSAFEKYFFSNGNLIHYKKANSINSVASDGKAGIKLMEGEKSTRKPISPFDLYIKYGSNRGGKIIDLPLIVDKKDYWLQEMIVNNVKVVRIIRKKIKGKYRYYVQLTIDSPSAIKYDIDTGEIKNPIVDGNVGIFIDTKMITICSKDGVNQINLIDKKQLDFENIISDINRYLDSSRRISNPKNYNEDGTIKKGIIIDGQKQRLTWTFSNNYHKAANKKADIQRKLAEQRKIRAGEITNLILSKGNNIICNNYNFKVAQMKKKEIETNKNGKIFSKKKAGKNISYSAPSSILTMLDNKLEARGYNKIQRVDIDKSAKITNQNRILKAQELFLQIEN